MTEIVLAPWLGHSLVIAVEMSDAKEDQRYYYWGTVWAGEGRLGQVTSGRILKSRDNFDITGLRNSTGDSIYVVLLRHARGAGEAIFGYVYTNNCPVLPASMHDDAAIGAVRILKATAPPPGMRLGDRWPAE